MWAESKEYFNPTLDEVEPDAMLILGKETKKHLPPLSNNEIIRQTIAHPSSRGFKYSDWQPVVQKFLEKAINSRA